MSILKEIEEKIKAHAKDLANNNSYLQNVLSEIKRLKTMKENVTNVIHQQNGFAEALAQTKKMIVDGAKEVTEAVAQEAAEMAEKINQESDVA